MTNTRKPSKHPAVVYASGPNAKALADGLVVWCGGAGLEVVSEITDDGPPDRGLRHAIAVVDDAGGWLVVDGIDHLGESADDVIAVCAASVEKGWQIAMVQWDGEPVSAQHVIAALAALDSHSERTRRGIERARAAGKPIGRPKSTVSAEAAGLIRQMRTTGATYQAIADELERVGHRSPSGRAKWHPTTVARVFSEGAVS